MSGEDTAERNPRIQKKAAKLSGDPLDLGLLGEAASKARWARFLAQSESFTQTA
jgi:hypothetical protein